MCTNHRNELHALLSRQDRVIGMDRTAPDSHVNYCFLPSPEKKSMHTLQRSTKLQVVRLQNRLAQVIEVNGILAHEDTHRDLQEIMKESTPHVTNAFLYNSFEKLFWEQQQKALQSKDGRQMRWHPLMIKWCLYLRHLSGKAYETIRTSGCIKLPSQRTLRD